MIDKERDMSRRDARDVAFKMIFEYTFSKEKKDFLLDEYTANFSAEDKSFAQELYFGVVSHFSELEGDIDGTIKGYKLNRLYSADKAILLLAIYEIKYVEGVPYKVSVDEALSLSKIYSTADSAKFINGVLAQFAREK